MNSKQAIECVREITIEDIQIYFHKSVLEAKVTRLLTNLNALILCYRQDNINTDEEKKKLNEATRHLKNFLDIKWENGFLQNVTEPHFAKEPQTEHREQNLILSQEAFVSITRAFLVQLVQNGTGMSVPDFVKKRLQQHNSNKPQIAFLAQVLIWLKIIDLRPKSENKFAALLCRDFLGIDVGKEEKGEYPTVRKWLEKSKKIASD